MQPQIVDRIQKSMEDVLARKVKFEAAQAERERVCNLFFDLESSINESIFEMVAHQCVDANNIIAVYEEKHRFCEVIRGDEQLERVLKADLGE